jgi:hypothetical protein
MGLLAIAKQIVMASKSRHLCRVTDMPATVGAGSVLLLFNGLGCEIERHMTVSKHRICRRQNSKRIIQESKKFMTRAPGDNRRQLDYWVERRSLPE